MYCRNSAHGFIAIFSVIIATGIMLVCMASVVFWGVHEQEDFVDSVRYAQARQSALGCSEYVIEQLTINPDYRRTGLLDLDGVQCTIVAVDKSDFPRIRIHIVGVSENIQTSLVTLFDTTTKNIIFRKEED